MARSCNDPSVAKPADLASAEAAMSVGLERMSSTSNYLSWLEELCAPHVGRDVLELGSGYGHLTERFAATSMVHASDISDHHVAYLEERFADSANVSVSKIDVSTFEADRQYDTIIMINVLEHIEDDSAAVAALREGLKPGGRLVVYVPAFMLLYSKFDREIGHYRRYRREPLRRLLESQGLRVVDARYVNAVGALGWFVYCRMLGRKSSDQLTTSACDRVVVPAVRGIERRYPPPFGLSILAVGERV